MTGLAGSGSIDPDYLDQLIPEDTGATDLVTFVIDAYQERAPRLLSDLHRAVASGDRSAAALHAHDLASTSGQVGALEITGVAREIEQLAEEGESALGEHCSRVDRLLPGVLTDLQDMRMRYESSNR